MMFILGISVGNAFTFDFNFGLMSTYQISIATEETAFKLAINLILPFMLFISLIKLRSAIEQERVDHEEEQAAELIPPAAE